PSQSNIDIVRYSWERVSEIRLPTDHPAVSPSHAFGLAFYEALFELNGDLKPLFANVFQQARALTGMISYLAWAPTVTGAYRVYTIREINARKHEDDDPEGLIQQMHELGARHFFYKVNPQYFTLVGPAFVSALKVRLGDEYRHEIGEAWIRTNSYAAYHMSAGLESQLAWEQGHRKQVGNKPTRQKSGCSIQ
ncbi:globin-like protein, partial [Phycomyces blakesleeanus]